MTDTTATTRDDLMHDIQQEFGPIVAELRALRAAATAGPSAAEVAARIRATLATVDAMASVIVDSDQSNKAVAHALRESFSALADELAPPR